MFSTLLSLYLYNDVTSKRYYTRLSVLYILLNDFIKLMHRILCDSIVLFNSFNKFRIEPKQVCYCLYISKK